MLCQTSPSNPESSLHPQVDEDRSTARPNVSARNSSFVLLIGLGFAGFALIVVVIAWADLPSAADPESGSGQAGLPFHVPALTGFFSPVSSPLRSPGGFPSSSLIPRVSIRHAFPPSSAARAAVRAQVALSDSGANDGDEVDWDAEAAKLARPTNPFYKAISSIEPTAAVQEFAETAPKEVQFAVKAAIASLLGNLPPAIGQSSLTTTGENLAALMFNMQMTGYMFRNAEYRRSLMSSIDKSLGPADQAVALPPVNGTVTVNLAGMKVEVDAAAYMSELRAEVEGLRMELVKAQQEDEDGGGEPALLTYLQGLDHEGQQQLVQDVSPEVLEAMSQLVNSILIDLNIGREQEVAAPSDKVRELLIWQLVSGYKLRELEVKDSLKDKFWGGDAKGIE